MTIETKAPLTINAVNLSAEKRARLNNYDEVICGGFIDTELPAVFKSFKLIFRGYTNLNINTQRRYEALLGYMREFGDIKNHCVTVSSKRLAMLASGKIEQTPSSVIKSLELLKSTVATYLHSAMQGVPANTLIKDFEVLRHGRQTAITVYFHEVDLAQLLESHGYTLVKTEYINKFKNKYATRLYELLRVGHSVGFGAKGKTATFKVKQSAFREMIGVEADKYTSPRIFNDSVIKRALAEITKLTQLTATFEYKTYFMNKYEACYIFTITDNDCRTLDKRAFAIPTYDEAIELPINNSPAYTAPTADTNIPQEEIQDVQEESTEPTAEPIDWNERALAELGLTADNNYSPKTQYEPAREAREYTGTNSQEYNKELTDKQNKDIEKALKPTGYTKNNGGLKCNNFDNRVYDYNSLEKQLLGWDK